MLKSNLEIEKDIRNLLAKYPEIQQYWKTARHIEDTDQCMVTLPCRNKDKHLMVLILEP